MVIDRERDWIFPHQISPNGYWEDTGICSRIPEEFPSLLVWFLAGNSPEIYGPCVLMTKKDSQDPGYPAESRKETFSIVSTEGADQRNTRNG